MKSFENATNAEAEVTAEVVVLRLNVTAVEAKAVTAVGTRGAERTRPIETVRTSVANSRTISATAGREEDMSITISD